MAARVGKVVLSRTGSLAANGSFSGSADCAGYSVLRGMYTSDASTTGGSGLIIEQSSDGGENWDLVSGSNAVAACGTSTCSITIFGNAVRISACIGADAASRTGAFFALYLGV